VHVTQNGLLSILCINDSDVPTLPLLRSVDLHHNSLHNDILEWMESGEHVSIETLKLCTKEHEIQAIAHCLQALGPSLKNPVVGLPISSTAYISCQGLNLEMTMSENFHLPWTLEAFWHEVDLSPNPNINSIHFQSIEIWLRGSWMYKADCVQFLLVQMTLS
jgi:hypothetical protein